MKSKGHGRQLRIHETWTCILCVPPVKGKGEESKREHNRTIHKLNKGYGNQGRVARRGQVRRDLFVPRERELE